MQKKTPLFDALKNYHKTEIVSFDVPGHKKRFQNEFSDYIGHKIIELDTNSMKELDILNNPTGVIREAHQLMAQAYSADEAFFLVNGTTSGIQTMVMSACNPGDKIILPRNVHKSAINALILSGATPVYIDPEVDETLGISLGVSIEKIKEAVIKDPDIKAVFIINPTYYGAVSDLEEIIKFCHKKEIVVLVDEAHGAHFPFHDNFPKNAMALGADMSAISIHKTGGSLTQSSVLLLKSGFIDQQRVKKMLNLTQTTSASYLLMTSLDVARKILVTEGEEIFTNLLDMISKFREELNSIPGIRCFKSILSDKLYDFDETKIGINLHGLGLTGFEGYDILREKYNIQMELADTHNILGIASIGDVWEDYQKLIDALKEMAKDHKGANKTIDFNELESPELVVSPRDAFYSETESIPLEKAIGKVSGESIMVYPPGIPLLIQGERISKDLIDHIYFLKEQKAVITGMNDKTLNNISILKGE
ncbi:aminotransferase class I/II-fold pyridoxal phosphate-dependent enzyme [Psychrilyobacter atlanticus]|uniref:aminotransferase class I/II-fold pyridoxal phosphate-dependent enzyme n=1 Tax=Psychrilyobacter atlanticus TaxID=271091 RepID=UPI0004099F1F|nr:aminotransferase class I/II-fold pyridoxal phosphate-dependent enzyme [Psychrilyobacter atlanticus]